LKPTIRGYFGRFLQLSILGTYFKGGLDVAVIIGLIDDNERELDDIQATITKYWKDRKGTSADVDFKLYELATTDDFKEKLQKELICDVESEQIQGLVIDYKLDSLRKVIEGRDIAEYLHEKVPAFPIVILTNAPERGKEEDEIDPDKVYDKEAFFNLDKPQSKEMVFNIRRNIERYMKQRTNLEISLSQALDQLNQEKDTDAKIKLLAQITTFEDKLGDYTQTGQTSAEKAFDLSRIQELVADLIKLEENF